MIWDIIEQSTFDKYFSEPNTTITTLLLDQNIITQLKNQNPKLLEYLNERKHQLMTQLIQYTISMPQQSAGAQRCHKLPYVSSELLAMDSELIYRQFFKQEVKQIDNVYWSQLLAFLDSEAAENEVLMGYFEKVVNNLYSGNKIKTTLIITSNLHRFSKLLPNGSIADILKKSLILLDTVDGAALGERKAIINHTISLFIKSNQQIKLTCSDILSEVIKKFQTFSSGEVLLEEILNSKDLLQIYSVENSIAVNQFLIDFIKKSHQKIYNEQDQSVPIIKIPELHLTLIEQYLKREVVKIGIISKSTGFIVNQNKQTVRKSSKSIYSLLQLVGLVIEDKLVSFVDECFLNFLWNIIILYPYNNILHVLIMKIFTALLQCPVTKAKQACLYNYQLQLMNLAKNNFSLTKQLIFTIWKTAKQYPNTTSDPNILSEFQNFVKINLEPLLQYQVKSIQHTHNTNKKLIVDEEDKAAANCEQPLSKKEEIFTQIANKSQQNSFFDNSISLTSTLENNLQIKSAPPATNEKDQFDSFNDWSPVKSSNVVIQDLKGKKDIFDDFANFI